MKTGSTNCEFPGAGQEDVTGQKAGACQCRNGLITSCSRYAVLPEAQVLSLPKGGEKLFLRNSR